MLNGIGAGPAESIQPAVIADIFFLHDRGFWNTVYWMSYMSSLMVGPVSAAVLAYRSMMLIVSEIISGTMSQHVGWRNFWWLYTALTGLSLLMVIFMFPETKWHRTPSDEFSSPGTASVEHGANKTEQDVAKGDTSIMQITPDQLPSDQASTKRAAWLRKGRPSRSQWGLYSPSTNPLKSILLDLWIPWKMFAFPIVEFSAFVVSWSCSSFLTINLTQSQNFSEPPYNYSPESIGFMNFAVLVGGIIGLATAGPLSDWVSARATTKNRGIREPEMRLPAMIPYVLIMILGNFIVAFGYDQKWPWEAIVIVGYTCAGIQVAALPAIVTTYSVDSYKPVAGSLMVAITVNKNVWGYGFAEFITPWVCLILVNSSRTKSF